MVTHREYFAFVLRSDCNMINNIKVTFRQYTYLSSRTRSIHLQVHTFGTAARSAGGARRKIGP